MKKGTVFLCIMLCAAFLCIPVLGEETECIDLSKKCTYKSTQKKINPADLSDDQVLSAVKFKSGAAVTVSWKAEVPAEKLYYFVHLLPVAFQLTEFDANGEILREEKLVPVRSCGLITLEKGCRSIELVCSGDCTVNSLKIFSAGDTLPVSAVYWTEEEKAPYSELMLFSAHYDDEILFMGAVPILYAGRDKRDVQVVYMRGSDMNRRMEALQGLWYMGVRREPVSLLCTNKSMEQAVKNNGAPGMKDDDIGTVVSLLRRYRPQVVVTHDVNGEYGHAVHISTSAIVRRAVELAADAGCYPESAEQYGAWQVPKLYVHLWPENKLSLDMGPVAKMGNQKVIRLAMNAMKYHKSQSRWSPEVQHVHHPMNEYGLYATAVGPDTPGVNDMFEHIPSAAK